jgi:hypothetical protein
MSKFCRPATPFAVEQNLSEELLDHIISFTARDSLPALCLTSKTLNRLATPHLYANLFLKETDDLPALAYLIFTSPAHAALIESLNVPDTWAEPEEKFTEWSWPRAQYPALEGVLREKCTEYTSNGQEANELYEKIESGANEDAILALLLASLPDLRKLYMNFGMGNRHEDFVQSWPTIMHKIRLLSESQPDATQSHALNSPQAAPTIARSSGIDVMVTTAETKYANMPVHVAMFMHLPNLRSLYAWKMGDNESDPDPRTNPFAKLKPRSCPVEYIELRSSKLHVDNLQYVLDAAIPGKLKTFSYEIGCTWAWCSVKHSRIMASLESHHTTLKSLSLSHEAHYPYQYGNDSSQPYACSFTPFTVLERLRIAPVYVWGHDGLTEEVSLKSPTTKEILWKALPNNLVELWITRAHCQALRGNDATIGFVPECLIPALELVNQNKREAFPKLERLCIELPLMVWKTEWFDVLASLCRSTSSNGIRSTIVLYDMFDQWGKLAVERQWGWHEDIEWEPTRYSTNRECAKVWVDVAQQQDLAQTLKDLRGRYEEENDKFAAAKREINEQGMLCTECQLHPDNDAAARIDLAQLARFVEQRLHADSC